MSSKMDMQGVRTAADLERKYQFGKNFSEVLGVATDAQTHAYQAEKAVEKLEKEVCELSILLKDEENGLMARIEAKLDADQLVSQFNMAFNEITITSDNFSLTAEGEIMAKSGLLGGWDIEEKRIFKINGSSLVQITAPESEDSDFITVSLLENDVVKKMPLSIKANGDIYTNGKVISANEENTASTEINNGYFSTNSGQIGSWYIGGTSLSASHFVSENVRHNVSLNAGLYNPDNKWDVDTAIDNSTVLYVDREDENGTKVLCYIRPNGEAFFGSKNTDQSLWISNGIIFSHHGAITGKTADYKRILLMYFNGFNGELMGLWVTGYLDENKVYQYTGLSLETL